MLWPAVLLLIGYSIMLVYTGRKGGALTELTQTTDLDSSKIDRRTMVAWNIFVPSWACFSSPRTYSLNSKICWRHALHRCEPTWLLQLWTGDYINDECETWATRRWSETTRKERDLRTEIFETWLDFVPWMLLKNSQSREERQKDFVILCHDHRVKTFNAYSSSILAGMVSLMQCIWLWKRETFLTPLVCSHSSSAIQVKIIANLCQVLLTRYHTSDLVLLWWKACMHFVTCVHVVDRSNWVTWS